MLVIKGTKLYGTVDQVPGVCHVATTFFHIWWFPIYPTGSYIVVDGMEPPPGSEVPAGEVLATDHGFTGVRVPLSGRSVLMGYLRGVLGLLAIWMGLGTVALTVDKIRGKVPKSDPVEFLAISSCSGLAFGVSRWLTRAGWSRANELRAELGLPPSDQH